MVVAVRRLFRGLIFVVMFVGVRVFGAIYDWRHR
jgi:hypothetical protein